MITKFFGDQKKVETGMSLVVTRVFYNRDQTLRLAPDKVMGALSEAGDGQFPERKS